MEDFIKTFSFGTKKVGPNNPCFIIAEAGVNHNGDIKMAFDLIRAAKDAGADAIKFQTFRTNRLVARGTGMADYQTKNTGNKGDQSDLLKPLEITEQGFKEIFRFCESLGILAFSTPDEEDSLEFLHNQNVPLFKIGSGEVTNIPFLKRIASKKRPVILSTGMSSMAETATAVETLISGGIREIAILHCVSAYPAPFEALNLRAIKTMSDCFGVPCGFSDHTLGTEAAVAAVALGALIIEKHLTLDNGLPGPDHQCSLNPADFKLMVKQIRRIESAIGTGIKTPCPIEMPTRKVVRKGLVASRQILSGTILLASDILVKRTGQEAVAPADLEKIIGFRINRSLDTDEAITWNCLKSS